ncbi:MAG: DNA-processing protein DprA [Deltaproteobacteria bacterium]|nr:DNA-processing protein DprA [Deltaproteobacteria bacterium]
MTDALSPNTQAILLLTAPLRIGTGQSEDNILSLGEYVRLARVLRDARLEPADLLAPEPDEAVAACASITELDRLRRLLERGFLLSQAVERWRSRAIWVVSRADSHYPRRLKIRLKDAAPPVLYGCGDSEILGTGGLAVVGSRDVDENLLAYTEGLGRLAATARKTLVSGGARGVDRAAMLGALAAGGRSVGVLADSLERSVTNREYRDKLLARQLVLVSPYDPSAGFNVGNAMRRNRLIYALADAAVVVESALNKGGTWAGAVEQLETCRFGAVYVRSTGRSSPGLDALRKLGALDWPNPDSVDALVRALEAPPPRESAWIQSELLSAAGEAAPSYTVKSPATNERAEPENAGLGAELFTKVREIIVRALSQPKSEAELVAELQVNTEQAKQWLRRLVDEGLVERLTRPIRYALRSEEPGAAELSQRGGNS